MIQKLKILKFFLLILFISFITSCLSIQTKNLIDFRKDKIEEKSCYIFGKFYIKGISNNGSNYISIGLFNEDLKEEYKIYLVQDYYIYAVKIPPGNYSINKYYYADSPRNLTYGATNDYLFIFKINPGEAVYLGDYFALCEKIEKTYTYNRQTYTEWTTFYTFEDYENNYKNTSFIFKQIYQIEPKVKIIDGNEINKVKK
ncbi:MAG TPA: hypothetical protein PLO89_01380 [Spirochaetota bacterium]|nr:hypothetical protein [Spirochaetota bacterium]